MRSYHLHEARSGLSKLVDRALAGEPQRVTRRGKEAVVIVSEEEWRRRETRGSVDTEEPVWTPKAEYKGLGDLLADFAEQVGFRQDDFVKVGVDTRPLGSVFDE